MPNDRWDEHIFGLLRDVSFEPSSVGTLCGGVTMSDVEDIEPASRPFERTASTFKH